MDKFHKADFFINVVSPILVGIGIYYMASVGKMHGYTRNQLPDGLWAWSLFSCILIIWRRAIHPLWISLAFVLCIGLEVLQHYQVIRGVGDYLDVMAYTISGTIALLANKFFFITFKYSYDKNN